MKDKNKQAWSSGRHDKHGHLEGLIQSGRTVHAWLKEKGIIYANGPA